MWYLLMLKVYLKSACTCIRSVSHADGIIVVSYAGNLYLVKNTYLKSKHKNNTVLSYHLPLPNADKSFKLTGWICGNKQNYGKGWVTNAADGGYVLDLIL